MDTSKLLEKVKALGYKGIVVTDHETIAGGLEAKNLNSDPSFQVIVGAEYHTSYGDLVGIGMTKEIENDHNPENVLSQLKAQGAKVAWVHPCRTFLLPRIVRPAKPFPPREFLDKLDYFETFNAQTRPSENKRAAELAEKYNLTPIRGLDAHFYFELKRPVRGYSLLGYLGSFFTKHWKRFAS